MTLLGNILWIFLGGGIVLFLEYAVAAIGACLTIIGLPFGVQFFKLAGLSLLPFGRVIERPPRSNGALATLMNLIWLVLAGFWIAVTHVLFGLLCAITIIGIPFAKQHFKLASVALLPFGVAIRP